MDRGSYPFETVSLLNRLNMEILVDYCSVIDGNQLLVVVTANKHYHRSTVSKNMEQIAFQLRKQLDAPDADYGFSIVEFSNRSSRRHKDQVIEEWWQWNFKWVGNTPLNAQRHKLPPHKVNSLLTLLTEQFTFKNVS